MADLSKDDLRKEITGKFKNPSIYATPSLKNR